MLSKEQVEYLYDFCYSEGIEYFDIQTELVDHLANAIEKEIAEHPDRTFDQALDIVVLSFGDARFKPLVVQQKAAAQRYCQRVFWSNFKQQLSWPLTWVLLAALLTGTRLLAWHDRQIVYHLCAFVSLIGWSLQSNNNRKGIFKPQESVIAGRLMLFMRLTFAGMACVAIARLFRDLKGVTGHPTELIFNLIFVGVSLVTAVIMAFENWQEVRRQQLTGKQFVLVDLARADFIMVPSTLVLFLLPNWVFPATGSIYLLFPAILSYFNYSIYLAYYRTIRQVQSRLKREFPSAFTTAHYGR